MREFICGYQTLLTCAGEFVGLALFLIFVMVAALLWLSDVWDTRQARKRTPHPECCSSPTRCDGAKSCWRVPNCTQKLF